MDGSTGTFDNVVLYQDVLGNLFLTNSNFAGTDLNRPGVWWDSSHQREFRYLGQAYTGLYQNALQSFVCFAAGTMVRTSEGDRRVDQITDWRPCRDVGQWRAGPCGGVGVQNVGANHDKLCPSEDTPLARWVLIYPACVFTGVPTAPDAGKFKSRSTDVWHKRGLGFCQVFDRYRRY